MRFSLNKLIKSNNSLHGERGGLQNERGGGASNVNPYKKGAEQVLSMLKGGGGRHNKF